jgi:hypothetical protein
MKISFPVKLMALSFAMLFAGAANAQPTPSDEETIKLLRTNIQRELENAPDRGAPDEETHRKVLLKFRSQLRDLLLEKRGALKVRIKNLEAPGALPEVLAHAEEIKRDLGTINDEIRSLDQTLGVVVVIPGPAPEPSIAVPPVNPKDLQERSEKRLAFEAAVNRLTSDDLTEAAAPKVVTEDKSPIATCAANGAAIVGTDSKPTRYDQTICSLAKKVNSDDRIETDGEGRIIYLAQDSRELFSILIAKLLKTTGDQSYVAFINEVQERRIDQQVGAGANSPGSTSLVSKGGVPYVLGFAVENGAATESRADTNITFRVNPAGLIKLFAKKGFITSFREAEKDPFMKFLGKTSVGLTFDTTRGDQPGTFTGDKQQLSAFSARVEFVNDRDPRLKKYEKKWEDFAANEGVLFANQIWKTTLQTISFEVVPGEDAVFTDPALQGWLVETNKRIAAVDTALSVVERSNAIAKLIRDRADELPIKLLNDQTVQAITDFARQFKAYTEKKNALLDTIARGKILTLEYTNKREINSSDTSSFNFIAATGTEGNVDLTANGSFTLFHQRPSALSLTSPSSGRFRDFQFAGQVAVPFKVGDSQFDFWFSGRYERLLEDASTIAGTIIPDTKGDIAVGQFGLNIPITSLGIKFPVSFTFANRTELVKEKEIRGNFGFTFNWDTLFSKLKPF